MKEIFLEENINTPIVHCFEYGDGYLIEIQKTIFGGRRITIREKDASYYMVNWCAGKEQEDCQKLVGLAQSVIDQDFPKVQFASEPKPYYNDESFIKRMDEIGFTKFKFQFK